MDYKGMSLDNDVAGLVRYMPEVDAYREILTQLQAVWDNLSLLGQLSGVGEGMDDTRSAFLALSQSLMNHLAREHMLRIQDSMHMKAAVSVDMMLRNLFERTADIGFLATDEAIVAFMQAAPKLMQRYGDDHKQSLHMKRQQMQQRLKAYVAKYSVYNNVILLSPSGDVLLQMEDTGVQHSQDALIQQALLTSEAYVEIFRPTSLLPLVAQPHIYAYRVEDQQGEALGVLCLCFDFQDECQRIFSELKDGDWSVMALTDSHHRVIASSDPVQLPIGVHVQACDTDQLCIQRFAGRRYFSMTVTGKGYQGYLGQGWQGHVMMPVEYAFESDGEKSIDMPVLTGLNIFSEALMRIPQQAADIQEGLNRSVWNGRIKHSREQADAVFGRALLWEVSQTGLKTKAVFGSAIENLYQTMIGAMLENNRFQASLAVNIMDRNLYERANDCRWWALTDTFRQVLSQDQVSSDDQQRLIKVLSYINQLYTVYTGLVVYDRQGCVLAVSQAHLTPWIGQVLSDAWMTESLGLTDSQTYRVSAFEPTALYADQSTFIYAAAIAHTEDERQAVGGIGIVFDSTPQLSAILSDASSGSGSEEGFAIFYDNQQRIVSTTHPNLSVGSVLPLDLDMAQRTGSAIVSCALGRYVVGVAKSSGYREFKGCDDDYQYEVYAAVFTRIGDLINDSQLTSEVLTCALPSLDAGPKQELATFFIQNQCYAFDVKQVVECVDVQMFTRLASGHSLFSGYVKYHGHPIPVLDLSRYLGATALAGLQAIVIEDEGIKFAILIDRLGGVPEVPISAMTPVEVHLQDHLVSHIVTAEDASDAMLLILSTSKIRQLVAGGRAMADAMPALSTLLEVGHAASE